MNTIQKIAFILLFSSLLVSCGSYFNQPIMQQAARTGEVTKSTKKIRELPVPEKKIVVGVYNFKDQTGQYKSIETGSTFSTAVSQGGTTMLIKALEDSKWFTPIERENLSNLLNERNIIRNTRKEYKKNNKKGEPNLPPLLYAGVLLEGGIVSYDTNIITGGLGARYFGVGASTQYREDRITVYLRAVSTSNGRILKTVYVSKTILSQAIDASLFRYVNFKRLLEVETGYTKNEPVQLALKEAIEKAVTSLIIEGIQEHLWKTKEGEEADIQLVNQYLEEKELEESKLLYNRSQLKKEFKNYVSFNLSTPLLNGDLAKKRLGYGASLSYSKQLTNAISLTAQGGYLKLQTGENYEKDFSDLSINAEVLILPKDILSPYLYGGLGVLIDLDKSNNGIKKIQPAPKVQLGVGLLYFATQKIAIKAFAESNYTFSDELDLIENGKRDDLYYNFGMGINYYFGNKKKDKTPDLKLDENENNL